MQAGTGDLDVIIIGGGQSALATAYFLRRAKLSFVILDAGEKPGGAWMASLMFHQTIRGQRTLHRSLVP